MFKSNKNGRGRLQMRLLKTLKIGLVGLVLTAPFLIYGQQPVEGAPSSTLNYQARLLGGSGAIVPDGYYNIQFKLYNAPSGGSALWTETRYDTNGVTAGNDHRIQVKSGYLSLHLADTTSGGTAFPTTINWNEEHWLTMNVGGITQTASPTWDGEMNPRIKLTAVPYAFQAGELAKTSGATRGKLYFDTVANSPDIKLPDASGTLCLQSSSACGFAAGSGDADYIQNTTTQQTNANFNILAGSGVAATVQGASGQNILVLNQNGGAAALTVTSTGNVTLAADLAVNGGDITSSGALNITPGGVLTLGATTQNATLQGAVTTITATGSGNDITLTSADQIILSPASAGVDINGVVAVGNNQTTHSQYVFRLGHTFDSTSACGFFGCYGVSSNVTIDNPTAPNSATAVGGQVSVINNTTLGSAASLFAASNSVEAGSTVTDNYGMLVATQSGGVTDYGVYVDGADDYGIYLNYGAALGLSTPNFGLYIKNADTYAIHVDDGATRLDGTLEVGTLGATDTNAVLCRNAAKQLANCSATFLTSATGFVQNGNSFGATAVLGTNDAQNLAFETAGTTRLTIDQSGNAALTGNLSVAVAGSDGVEILGADAAYEDKPSLTFGPGGSKPWTIVPGGASNSLEVYGQSSVVGAFLLGGGFRVGNTDTGNPLMMPNATSSNPAYTFNNDDDTGMYSAGVNVLGFSTGGTTRLTLGATGDAIFSGNIVVQGTGTSSIAGTLAVDSNTLFVDATTNRVGIGSITPGAALEVTGDIYLTKEANRTIKVANSTTSTVVGGALSLLGGDGNNSFGGAITIKGGSGAGTGIQVGGAVNILGGDSVGFVTGSNVNITAGGGIVGGQLKLNGGTGFGTSGHIILQDADPNGSVGIGVTAPDARLELGGNKNQAAWGLNGIQLQASSATYTDASTAASGVVTNAAINSFGIGTIAANNTNVTVSNAATVYIQGAPTNGANVNPITNAYALWIDAGTARFDGTVDAQGGTITNSVGALSITSASSNAITLDSGTTGTVNVGTSANAKTVNIGTGASVANSINIGGTGANIIAMGNAQAAGSVSLGAAMTTGTVSIGGTGAQTGTIDLGVGTGAQTINLGTGGTGVKTINLGTGSAANIISVGTTQTGGSISLGTAMTGGTVTIGGAVAQTGTIILGQSTATNTVRIGDGTGATTIQIGTGATNAKTIQIGTGASVANAINLGGTGANVIAIGNTQTGGSISLGAAMTTGTVSIGGSGAQTGTIDLGVGTGVQAINLGTGGTGAKTVTLGSTASTGSTTIQSGSSGITFNTAGTVRALFDTSNNLFLGNGATSGSPNAFAIKGTASTTTAVSGGALTIQGGNANTGNANGGNLLLSGGTGVGTGVNGLVVISTPTLTTTANDANCYTGGALVASSCTIAGSSVNNSAAIIVGFNTTSQVATVPDPTITTAGRIVYITAANGSSDFTLRYNTSTTPIDIAMRANNTATLIWNGADWTAAGASSSTDLQSAYNNTLTSAGGAEIVLNPSGGSADGLTIRNNGTTPTIGGVLEVQTSIGTNIFSVNNNISELAANGGAENITNFATNWTSLQGAGSGTNPTVARTTTSGQYTTGLAGVSVLTDTGSGTTTGNGVRNNLVSNPATGTTYMISFTAKLASGTFTDMRVDYTPTGAQTGTQCIASQTIVTSDWTRITCEVTTPGTSVTNPDILIYQVGDPASARTFYIDNLSMTLADNSGGIPNNVQIGGGINGGAPTLFTLDRSSAPPVANGNTTYLGSMYYDTTTGRIQCYESDGWGACGSAPDNIITLTPEYTGAVLNGSGIGTMTADFCGNGGGLSANTTFCATNEARNYYRWTSPQTSDQTYSIYVTYKLPNTFKEFTDDNTIRLTAYKDHATNAQASLEVYRKPSVGSITQCGSTTTVTTGTGAWNTTTLGGTGEKTGCTWVGSDYVIFKINVTAKSNANVYIENLDFTYLNQ